MASSSIIIIITIFFFFLFITANSAAADSAQAQAFKSIYAFGDSYTDTGNTRSQTGPNGYAHVSNPPYGKTFFHRPTNRYSDGRLVIDFVAQNLSLPFLTPYLSADTSSASSSSSSSGLNFAVAGSTAIIHSFFASNNLTLDITPQSLLTQLAWFDKVLGSRGCVNSSATPVECGAVFDDSLIWVGEIGANDYAYTLGSTVTSDTIQRLAIGSFTRFLEAILNRGAKYVVVEGLPTTGCLTLAMALSPDTDRDSMGCAATSNEQSSRHNTVLKAKLNHFRKRFPNAIIAYADFMSSYITVMKDPKKYGMKELFSACCGSTSSPYNLDIFNTCGSPMSTSCSDPSQYVNWDGVHLTEAMYKAVAESFLVGNFCEPSFQYLLAMKRKSG